VEGVCVSCACHAFGMHVACTWHARKVQLSSPVVSDSACPQVIARLYQSEDAALQALRQNSQILLPVYSSPTLLQVRNPCSTACNPIQHGLQPHVATACAPMSMSTHAPAGVVRRAACSHGSSQPC
jgi:hypothetical protein